MHPRAEAFRERVRKQHGFEIEIHEFSAGTKTAADAAAAIGCDVAQIASSIALETNDSLVVSVTSGANRVSMEKVSVTTGTTDVEMADAETIKATLGWSIGGVPPFCHDTDVPVFMDETLTRFETVWAAAGTPQAVFPIAPHRLREFTDATIADIAE